MDEGKSTIWGFLAVFLGIIGILVVLLAKKDDNYAMYYLKQSLVLVIGFVAAGIVSVIPIIGWIVGAIAMLVFFVLWIIAWINALSGQTKETPLIGKYAEKFKF
ncbi:MAG TPA: DUF4870 domain-containing protein [Candidatus Woesearchaeota archaeon]|nr:DUF4870 domain-containing protein [Candidatus Woesearchaeota archaeon]